MVYPIIQNPDGMRLVPGHAKSVKNNINGAHSVSMFPDAKLEVP